MEPAAFREEYRALMERLESEPGHALSVARLALRLFDELLPLHQLGVSDRLLLEAAACLHDIGWTTAAGGREHHKESARLILLHPWQSAEPFEVAVVAQVARYHRRAIPSTEHDGFATLPPADRLRVQHLSAMLRLADALDRRHEQRVADMSCLIRPTELEFRLLAELNVDREIASAEKKGDLARRVYQRDLSFHRAPP